MSIVLEMISDIILLTSIVVIVYFRDSMDPGLVGNCLLYVLLLPDNIYAVIFATATVENSMVSVERIHNMTTISPEDLRTRHKDEVLIKTNWPMHGCIEFQKYSTKYRPDTGIVLNSISVSIKSKEKIGIVNKI